MSSCFALDKLDSLALTLYVNFWYIIIFIIFKMFCLAIIQKCGISVNSHIVALGDDVPRISAIWFRGPTNLPPAAILHKYTATPLTGNNTTLCFYSMLGLMRWFELAKPTALLTDSVESSI